MTKRWDVLGFGAVAVDDLVYVNHYPAPDAKVPVARRGARAAGWPARRWRRRRGWAQSGLLRRLGEDELSRFTIQELEREGVDCSAVVRRAGATPIHSIIVVDRSTAQRVLLFDLAHEPELRPDEISEALIADCGALFVDHTVIATARRAAAIARRPASRWWPTLRPPARRGWPNS